jgi:sialate O-acetylesterase
MIAPIIPMAMRGVIWYQGENNAGYDSASRWSYLNYRRRFGQLITGWRRAWGQGDYPFIFVQLPEMNARQSGPVAISPYAEVREGQRLNLAQPNTAMAVTLGLGDPANIHPRNKAPVGLRLSLCALAAAYGRSGIAYSGPMYSSMEIEGNRVRLHFRFAEGGLASLNGGKLEGFAIAGADGRFVWADAIASGDTIVVSSPQVASPVEVRYAWADNPVFGLRNGAGLPASPFRTSGPQLPVSLAVERTARDRTHATPGRSIFTDAERAAASDARGRIGPAGAGPRLRAY